MRGAVRRFAFSAMKGGSVRCVRFRTVGDAGPYKANLFPPCNDERFGAAVRVRCDDERFGVAVRGSVRWGEVRCDACVFGPSGTPVPTI